MDEDSDDRSRNQVTAFVGVKAIVEDCLTEMGNQGSIFLSSNFSLESLSKQELADNSRIKNSLTITKLSVG